MNTVIWDRPILFAGAMVRAIRAGTKTQTRRIMNPQPESVEYWRHGKKSDRINGIPSMHYEGRNWLCCGPFKCPFLPWQMCHSGERGAVKNSNTEDTTERRARLWVRETWRPMDGITLRDEDRSEVEYRATDDRPKEPTDCHWKPSIHMPRWASRITLEITHVRVERLQEISEHDATCEGIEIPQDHDYIAAYRRLWESINGPKSWDLNPWVWVIEFTDVSAR